MNTTECSCSESANDQDVFFDESRGRRRYIIHRRFRGEISPEKLDEIIFHSRTENPPPALSPGEIRSPELPRVSRGTVQRIRLSDGSEVVLREFLRGGIVQRLLRRTFVRSLFSNSSGLRPIEEFKILSYLQKQNILVPFPAAAIVESHFGGLLYRGYLLTENILGAENFLEFLGRLGSSAQQDETVREIALCAGREARKMLEAGVFHPDLHLGNVLFDNEKNVYLIDFDKAFLTMERGDARVFTLRTQRRWCRSVDKHFKKDLSLSEILKEGFGEGLEHRTAS